MQCSFIRTNMHASFSAFLPSFLLLVCMYAWLGFGGSSGAAAVIDVVVVLLLL